MDVRKSATPFKTTVVRNVPNKSAPVPNKSAQVSEKTASSVVPIDSDKSLVQNDKDKNDKKDKDVKDKDKDDKDKDKNDKDKNDDDEDEDMDEDDDDEEEIVALKAAEPVQKRLKSFVDSKRSKKLTKPFPLNLVLRNTFIFCSVSIREIDSLFKLDNSVAYSLLKTMVEKCGETGLVDLRRRFEGKSKDVLAAVRKLFSDWTNSKTFDKDDEIYNVMKEKKFPKELYELRDYVKTKKRGKSLSKRCFFNLF